MALMPICSLNGASSGARESCYYLPLRVLSYGNDSNLLIVFYVQIMPDDLVMQLHRF